MVWPEMGFEGSAASAAFIIQTRFFFSLNPSQLFSPPSCVWLNLHLTTSSHKTFSLKWFWVKIQKQSCPIPHWIQMKPSNKIRYTSERRHWRRIKLGLQEASHRKCTHLYCVKAWLIWEDPDAGRDWAGGEGDDRGWDGWMASPAQWTWVWVNSRNWWWTGRPGVLQFMGSQRVGHNWATELNWTEGHLHINQRNHNSETITAVWTAHGRDGMHGSWCLLFPH